MAYDKNIPDVLQLLRLDLGNVDYTVSRDTTIARYTIVGDYFPRYCIADVADDADTMTSKALLRRRCTPSSTMAVRQRICAPPWASCPRRKSTRTSSSPVSTSP